MKKIWISLIILLLSGILYLNQGKEMKIVGTDTRVVTNITKEEIYTKWSDINNWHTFNDDLEYAKLDGEFKEGNYFTLGLKVGKR